MNFKWFLEVIKNHYVDFSGRTSKRDFWMYMLHYVIIAVVLSVVDSILGLSVGLGFLFWLALLLPNLGIGARRLQDTGKSPLWLLLLLLTCVGIFVLIFFWVQDSQEGSNEYGEKPANTI